jgi:hypothetical protein
MSKTLPAACAAASNATQRRIRVLTVSAVYREWGVAHQRRHTFVPALRLSGDWLRVAGFKTGEKVQLHSEGGVITIRLDCGLQTQGETLRT